VPIPAPSLETRVANAVAKAVGALTPQVPSARVFVRPAGLFAPARDDVPALVVCTTPGQGAEVKRMLHPGRTQVTTFTTVILADAQNAGLMVAKSVLPDPDWRSRWRVLVATAVAGHRLAAVPECVRVFSDPGETLDMTQFEASNLWWSAVTFRAVCRVDTP
jgi:hypothetical protein